MPDAIHEKPNLAGGVAGKKILTALPAEQLTQLPNAAERITALWALSEAALGGILHAFRIPFTGLFIGGSAVIFITLIALFSDKKNAVLKATLLVMIIKALASPHTPLNAYISVAFQGLTGELLFRWSKFPAISAALLGVLSLLQSALQKVLVLTLLFGQNLWESIDLFGNYVLKQFSFLGIGAESLQISMSLISIYILIHLAAGLAAGLWAPRLAQSISREWRHSAALAVPEFLDEPPARPRQRKRWKRLSNLAILTVFLCIFIGSYLFPVFEKTQGTAALLMIFRSVLIMSFWYIFLAPVLLKYLHQILRKKKTLYSAEIANLLAMLPFLRLLVKQCWRATAAYKKLPRLPNFARLLLVQILFIDFEKQLSPRSEKSANK